MDNSRRDHWNVVYTSKAVPQLGWYEATPEPSLRLLDKCGLAPADPILDAGAGASTFIDHALERGYQRLIAVDLSEVALGQLKGRLGAQADRVQWLIEDVTQPDQLLALEPIALWHDRAVLHFMIEEWDRQAYFDTLQRVVRTGGYVSIAAFALQGATRCSGLDVRRYDAAALAEFLGVDFTLIESFDYTYHMPSGDLRPYVYTLFQRGK